MAIVAKTFGPPFAYGFLLRGQLNLNDQIQSFSSFRVLAFMEANGKIPVFSKGLRSKPSTFILFLHERPRSRPTDY